MARPRKQELEQERLSGSMRSVPVEDWAAMRAMQGKDACEMPDCDKEGIPGNENVVNGVVMCDGCVVKWDRWACRRVIQMVKGVSP